MISLARAVHNVETGDFVGVFALDFLVNSLQQYVQPSYNLEREMVLFVSSGRVLLDSEWFSNSSSAEIDYTSTYSTIVNPTFSDKEWSVIQGIDPGKNTDLEVDGEYHCYVFRFLEPMEGLVFVACADLDVQLEVHVCLPVCPPDCVSIHVKQSEKLLHKYVSSNTDTSTDMVYCTVLYCITHRKPRTWSCS